jgi:hypothetical protein
VEFFDDGVGDVPQYRGAAVYFEGMVVAEVTLVEFRVVFVVGEAFIYVSKIDILM